MTTSGECSVYSFGLGFSGQLGIGSEENQFKPKEICRDLFGMKSVCEFSCGTHHTIALTVDGEVYSFGRNEQGQLGRSEKRQMVPQLVESLCQFCVVKVACGEMHSFVVTNNGEVFSWGYNDFGQLALGDYETRLKPCLVKDVRDHFMISVACGAKHTLLLSARCEVLVCGRGREGQLGLGDCHAKEVQQQQLFPQSDRKWAVRNDWLWGSPVIDIKCGQEHSMVLTIGGNVYAFGSNKFGQLGIGPEYSQQNIPMLVSSLIGHQIVAIECGSFHTFAISRKGPCYAFGSNLHHQLGFRSHSPHAMLPEVTSNSSSSLTDSAEQSLSSPQTSLESNFNSFQQNPNIVFFPTVIFELLGDRVYKLTGGSRHSIALRKVELPNASNDSVSAKLQNPNSIPSISSSSDSLIAEKSPVLAWGTGSNGELGLGESLIHCELCHPVDFFRGLPVTNIFCGPMHSIVVVNGPMISSDLRIQHLSLAEAQILINSGSKDSLQKLDNKIISVFSSISNLNASFLKRELAYDNCFESAGGVNFSEVRKFYSEAFSLLANNENKTIIEAFHVSILNLLNSSISHFRAFDCQERLRFLLILFENPLLLNTSKQNLTIIEKLCSLLMGLPESGKEILSQWLKR